MAKYLSSNGLAYFLNKLKSLMDGKADKNHTHTNVASADKVNNALSIQLNGGTATTFDGSVAKSINVTAASVGAIPTAGGVATGKVEFNKGIKVNYSGNVTIEKNSLIDFKKSYLNFDEAFIAASTNTEYALLMTVKATTKDEKGSLSTSGMFGIHQHQSALYVGYQNNDTSHAFCQYMLINAKGESGFETVSHASTTYLPLTGGTITGDVTVNGKVLTVNNNGRISVKKDTTYDAATKAYLSFNDAFYTAYSEKNYSLIMLTPAITAENAYPGNLGMHQENGGLYVAFQNHDKKNRKDIKLIASDGTTDLVLKSDNVLYASRVAKLTNNKTDLTTMIGDDWEQLATINNIAWWNGRFNANESSLRYCSLGAFGSATVKNIGYGAADANKGWDAKLFGEVKEGDIYIQLS